MFGLGRKREETEYERGYEAAEEFLDLTSDRVLSDEECDAQWGIIEANHSDDYIEGYAQFFEDESTRPWWKLW